MKFNLFGNREPEIKDQPKIRIELSESYGHMVSSIAWKDLELFFDEMIHQSIKDEDQVKIQDLTVAEASRGRGIREAIDKLRRHVGFYTSGEVK